MSNMPPRDAEMLALAAIGRLPQAAVLDPEHVKRWLTRTMDIDHPRLSWHIARAGGIGGSEAGALVQWMHGDVHARSSAHRLAKQKLLMLPPDRPDEHMMRGIYLEPYVRTVYEEKLTQLGHNWRRRDDLVQAISSTSHPQYPWLRASLDGVYEIDGAIIIVDFKAPSEDMLVEHIRHKEYGEYRAQLNHYDLVAEGAGITADAMQLILFDYKRAGTVGVHIEPIDRDMALQQKILNSSESFWNDYILQGRIPDLETKNEVVPADGIPRHIEATAQRLVVTRMAIKSLQAEEQEAVDAIRKWTSKAGTLSDNYLALGSFEAEAPGMLKVTAKRELDVERAIQRLQDLGMSMADIQASCRGPDVYSDLKRVAEHYGRNMELMSRIHQSLEAHGEVSAELGNELKKIVNKPLSKKDGPWDAGKVHESLVACNESPYNFESETFRVAQDQSNRADIAERAALVQREIVGFLGYLAPTPEPDILEELPEGPPAPAF